MGDLIRAALGVGVVVVVAQAIQHPEQAVEVLRGLVSAVGQ